ncbi:MAG TPA: 2-oxoglutarate and iron-dependent oxygenase domain-containing protein [Alphaproteobacteria bacterium]|nr:2-oxoglutarate and iron-dependent oxygenase domain-containing protein [Alphaproteobacteria bacterium]
MSQRIPVIDLSDAFEGVSAARRKLASRLDRICREIGFFTIVGHGVPSTTLDDLRDRANEFFALPPSEKQRAIHPIADTPRGYRPIGIEALSYGNERQTPADLKEYYHFGRETWPEDAYFTSAEGRSYFIPNLWPEWPPGFGGAARRYYAEMERIALALMRLAALGLDVDEHFFDDKIDRHITAMRLNFYPAQAAAPLPGQLRAGEHTDYGTFTILNGENVPGGLQVLTRDGDWVDVETDARSFVVNIGDLLMRWTNDRWISNTHRVVNPPADIASRAQRLSIAFFHHPNYDASIECIAPPGTAKYPPVKSGEYRDSKYRRTRLIATTT